MNKETYVRSLNLNIIAVQID
uniref:Uncharacterized protein n=1 Tax=Anguilla anguilla TaxID=7936 RepID=A0A0E9V5X2_ANGAN